MKLLITPLRALFRLLFWLSPQRMHIPLRYQLTALEGGLEPELLYLDRMAPKGGTALDIGANIGIFSYRLSGIAQRVVSFEINDDLLTELQAWNPGNIEVVAKGLSSEAHEATLYIPVLNGKKLVGWASLAPGNCPDTSEHVTKRVETVTLDSLALRNVTFIKIDVEGHELEVLRGATETLRANRPVMMIEIRDHNLTQVRELLDGLGYAETTMKALTGHEGSEGNYFFTPRETA